MISGIFVISVITKQVKKLTSKYISNQSMKELCMAVTNAIINQLVNMISSNTKPLNMKELDTTTKTTPDYFKIPDHYQYLGHISEVVSQPLKQHMNASITAIATKFTLSHKSTLSQKPTEKKMT